MTKCPPGTTIRQVQGTVDVEERGSVLLQVDGQDGKNLIRLDQTLIVPGITVKLFYTGDGISPSLRRSGRQMHPGEEDSRQCHETNRDDVNEERKGHTRLQIV